MQAHADSTVGRPDGSVLLRLHGCVDFEVDADLRGVTAWRDPRCDPELYTLLVAGNLLATVLTLRGETVLHASAVERDGRAVAFVAHSGMGKSTLAALACARGARFLTDDLLRFEHRPDGRVHCLPVASRIDCQAAAEILGFAPDGAHRVSVDERSVWRPEATTRPSAELVAVVLPQLDRGARSSRSPRWAAPRRSSGSRRRRACWVGPDERAGPLRSRPRGARHGGAGPGGPGAVGSGGTPGGRCASPGRRPVARAGPRRAPKYPDACALNMAA